MLGGLKSREPSTTKESEDDVNVLLEDVSLGREWVTKVNERIDAIEIFGQHFGKVEGTLGDHIWAIIWTHVYTYG
ncbi:hypothetical protein H5410_036970 [Solanum commersonii]|uniref:Uncharacterized protein n=1 Tax=Solanum commersonii TaxID=4109 RepID=A0A9J5Y6R0_SOLCO|nr:hypothetical protein H5410_036970 [Solanum commersonii]